MPQATDSPRPECPAGFPYFWLTDYLLAANLQAAYEARAEADAAATNASAEEIQASAAPAAASSNVVALTPEVKQAIAEEVKAQLAAEQSAAGQGASSAGQQPARSGGEVPPALDPARRTFVVATDLSLVADGQECALTPGDVITRLTDTPDENQSVTVSVSASKKTDCAAGKQVAVSVNDLQEMHNRFREQLDGGLKTLAAKQGTGGLPKAPDISTVAGEVPAPPADTTAAKALQDQQAAADQTESDVQKETSSASAGGGS